MIGNRLRAATGSIDPNDPAAATYTPNALNQYSQITNNSITNNPAFDADGNMTSGPLPANVNANSTLVWDGENRLIQAQITGGATVNFTYDSQSRRIAETVGTNTKLTVYDGWNPIAEYAIQNSTFTIQNSYLWGIDLSGTLQGAGGVGGLLMTSLITNNSITSNYFPTYDGNGNVSEYLNESGEVSAHYEYDPFGKTTVATGPEANDFAHRFSTKPLDLTTGLYYYGYRFYDPVTGRWPSRDPIQERGGLNLYGFVRNDALGTYDILGYAPPGKKLPGQGKKKKGKGCPNDGQKPTAGADGKAEDSAGSKCCPDKMTKVTLYVEDGDSKAKVGSQAASGDGISSGHTFLGVGNGDQGNQDVTGFYPGGGFWGKPGRYEDDSDHNYTDKCDYWACPDTLESLEDDIEDDLDDERAGNCRDYNLLGTQCTTWAKEKLKNAGFPWPGGRTPAQTANQL
jgi:RHS repeat-associated protein